MASFAATFSLDPKKFPYTKQIAQSKRDFRQKLDGVLFFDLVLTEVAQVTNPAKLYPPKNTADLRTLHEAIEKCPVDLLKKQCCIYYILRDWDTHEDYAKAQYIPDNYCNLMTSYWHLDNGKCDEALQSLTMPGLIPNFATKILQTFTAAKRYELLVTYVHTLQPSLDTDEKVKLYIKGLVHLDVGRAIMYTRTLADHLRQPLFEAVINRAKSSHEGATILSDFPFTKEEDAWLYTILSQSQGHGLEALALRLTMIGKTTEVLKLRRIAGGGRHDVNNSLRDSSTEVQLKLAEA